MATLTFRPARCCLLLRLCAEVTAILVAQANMSQQVAATATGVLAGAAGTLGQASPALEGAIGFLNESVLGVRD